MKIKNNELSYANPDTESVSKSFEEESKYVNVKDDQRKVSSESGEAQILVTRDAIVITSKRNGFAVGPEGSVIGGPVAFLNSPSDIRFNMFWRFNDELLTTIPSTLYTPIPVLLYDEPPFITQIQKLAKFFA